MDLFSRASELKSQGKSFVMVTMTSVRGSAPQDPGAKALVTTNGLEAGTVGGGKVEARAIELAQEILQSVEQSPPQTITWNLQKDIGMTCGGEVTFLFEHFHATNWPIVIFGAGHVSQALTRTLLNLNCQVTCLDPREEWTSRLPEGINILTVENPADEVKNFPKNSFFISMTKGHAFDVPILKAIYDHAPNCPYVGVIGSNVKGDRIKTELTEKGVSQEFISKMKVPLGLPIGNNDPYEIAISITAELLQIRDQI